MKTKKKLREYYFLGAIIKQRIILLIVGLLFLLCVSLFNMPIPELMGRIVNLFTGEEPAYHKLLMLSLLILGLHFLKTISSWAGKYLLSKYSVELSSNLRVYMINRIIGFPMSVLNKYEKGYVFSRVSESSNVSNLFSPSMISIVIGSVDFIFSMYMLFNIEYRLTFIVLLFIPLFYVTSAYFSRRIKKIINDTNEKSGQVSSEMFDTLNALEEIKLLNKKHIQLRKIRTASDQLVKSMVSMNNNLNLYSENIVFFSSVIGTIILYLSGLLIFDTKLTVGGYVSFSGYLSRLLGYMQMYSSIGLTVQPILVSLQRIKDFLNTKDEEEGRTETITSPIERISFHNVFFHYDQNCEVLDNISFDIMRNERVLFNGANGAGKSTIIKMLMGLYNPTEGLITINSKDLSSINLKDLRNKIAFVSQHVYLFKDTVLRNILEEENDQKEQELYNFIELYDFPRSVNELLNVEVENGGANLSGGQKQLIGCLRAILTGKEVIILDEPTSNMDLETKRCIMNIIENYTAVNIFIVISHDKDFDFISKKIVVKTKEKEEKELAASV
ncbi:ABC transporter ATP-binding protein [Paenibacillus piscarius]|uniref:ABC transporter ATP-binding protein n=1 Tax=Paenibacillus piscarius TaxID=1089681 RepID=UPI001EE7DF8D|nr:ABC transporter ATP-binding protein [Paenibacillus piscarius]